MMDISARSLHIKRDVISRLLDEGLYPYTKRYLGSFENHFSTIGLVGMNEAGLNACWLKKDMTDPETQKFTKEVLEHMRNRLSDYQEPVSGRAFQSGGNTGGIHRIPPCQTRQKPLSGYQDSRKRGRYSVLHKQLPSAG